MRQAARLATLAVLTLGSTWTAQAEDGDGGPKYHVFAGYSALREDGQAIGGWESALHYDVRRHLGLTIDVTGHYRSEPGLNTKEHSVLAGLWFSRRAGITPFAYALAGVGRGSATITDEEGLTRSSSETSFNWSFGGGVDISIARKLALRGKVGYLLFDSEGGVVLSVGVVLGFGPPAHPTN